MEIKKILWASDGSNESEEALRYVGLFANKYGSEVIGLSVIQPVDLSGLKVSPEIKKELVSIQATLERREYERVKKALEQLEPREIKWGISIRTGVTHEEILKVADEEKVDLIVMGKRGLGIRDRILIGSNTSKVLRAAKVPVLAVRHKKGSKKGDKIDIEKILVPTDLSESTSISLDIAVDLAERFRSAICLLHVIELHHSYETSTGRVIEELCTLALEELRLQQTRIPEEKLKEIEVYEKVTLFLRAWFGIVDFAEKEGIDLIVMTTHGRKGFSRFILGSVTEKVISGSPCPVLAIKP